MAERKTKIDTIPEDQREEIMIPRGGANEDPNLFVSVNGVNYLLPRGKKSKVPTYVAEEIRRAWAAQEALDDRIQALMEANQ